MSRFAWLAGEADHQLRVVVRVGLDRDLRSGLELADHAPGRRPGVGHLDWLPPTSTVSSN